MNLSAVEKVLEHLNSGKFEEAVELLKFEREKLILNDKGAKHNELKGVKNYLKRAEKDGRVVNKALYTVQEDTDGKPFICDGFSLVKWHEPQEWLNAFAHTPQVVSVQASKLIPAMYDCKEHRVTAEEKLVLKNLDKYIKLYKDGKFSNIKLFDRYWDANLLKGVLDIIGTDIEYVYTRSSIHISCEPIVMYEETKTAMALPIRMDNNESIDTRYNEFVKQLKERV